jgi:type VI secretion system secreted protein Hcp
MALFDSFLKIPGIDGECTDEDHMGWIGIKSFSFGVRQDAPIGSYTSGAGSAKTDLESLKISKMTDASSPKLFLGCANGTPYDTATLVCRKAGGSEIEYLEFDMETVLIASYKIGANLEKDDDEKSHASETFELVFGKITYQYIPQREDGSSDVPVIVMYDAMKPRT